MDSWVNYSYIDILKIKDEKIKEEYQLQYHRYIYKISYYIFEELDKRGLDFQYSGSVYGMKIKEMFDELSGFCIEHGIDKKEQRKIIYKGYIKDLIKQGKIDIAKKLCEEEGIPYKEVRGRKR